MSPPICGLDCRRADDAARTGRGSRRSAGVKGIHIAERDTQRATTPKPMGVFVNTWSVEASCRRACSRPNSAGARMKNGCRRERRNARIWAARRRSICCGRAPTRGCAPGRRRARRSTACSSPTTSRSRSPITSRCARAAEVVYRPTCHYAYHPANDAVLSLRRDGGRASGSRRTSSQILDENEIVDGIDELGVLLYGHAKNAYWYGSQLSIEETRRLAPYQNATGLQVTSRRARRHGVGAGKSASGHCRGRRNRLPPLPRSAACPTSAR